MLDGRLASFESNGGKPRHCRHQRHVEHAARVVDVKIDGFAGCGRTDAIKQGCAKEMGVDLSPCPNTVVPNQVKPEHQHQLFAGIEKVKAASVGRHHGDDVLPGNHNKRIEVEPPGE